MTTHLRPHTASQSPARPVSSYSVGSTIRRVTPSPESLSEALSQGYAAHSTPRHHTHKPSTKDPRLKSVDESTLLAGEHTEDGERAHAPAVRAVKSPGDPPTRTRRITPSRIPVPAHHASGRNSNAGNLKRRKAGRISPSKLGAPRQHRTLLPSSPASPTGHKAIAATAASGSHTTSAGPAMPGFAPLTPPLAPDEERDRLRAFTLFPTEDPFAPTPQPALDPTRPAPRSAFQEGKTHYEHEIDAITPLVWKKSARRLSPSVPSTPPGQQLPRHSSGRSVASTFSTPGRDEMERKRGHAEEGPFAHAEGVQELAERRRMISESDRKAKGEGRRGLCGCAVM